MRNHRRLGAEMCRGRVSHRDTRPYGGQLKGQWVCLCGACYPMHRGFEVVRADDRQSLFCVMFLPIPRETTLE